MLRLAIALIALSIGFGAPLASASGGATTSASGKGHATKAGKKKLNKPVAKGKKHNVKAKKLSVKAKSKSKLKARKGKRVLARSAARPATQAHRTQAPIALEEFTADGELQLRSASVLVVKQQTGEALYAKNPEMATPIASITKLMTALVTLDAGLSMHEPIQIDREDIDRLKGTGSRLPLGATLSRGELLNLALIASENRAAAALSRAFPGGRDAFVMAMNRKARELGMHNTYFVDGTGLSSANRSTAADLVKLVDASYQYPEVREITSTGRYDVEVPGQRIVKVRQNGRIKRVTKPVERRLAYVNTNALTRNVDWDIGVSKTGYINEAGHCLVMQTRIAGEKVIIVLLDSLGKWSRIGDANRVRRWLESGGAGKVAAHMPASGAV
jgi:D-alanyl-D-alanine endopeptidase (penicillin-binding protein 7)